jgi:hypothetical protein
MRAHAKLFLVFILKEEKNMAIFTGAGVAIITPMNQDGSVLTN